MQKSPGNTQRRNADPKTQKRPEATQGVNTNPNTQKVPEVIQGGEPRKPENSRARRRRESQLITAAPLESATLRWTPPRERPGYVNLKAPRTSHGPRGGRVARREKRELERPRIVQNLGEGYPILRRTRTDFFISSYHKPLSPLHQKRAPLGSIVSRLRQIHSGRGAQT